MRAVGKNEGAETNSTNRKRNTYVTHLDQTDSKSGGSKGNLRNTAAEDEKKFTEGKKLHQDNDPVNTTADPADSSEIEDGTKNPVLYENMPLPREKVHMPTSTKLGHPECEEAALSIRRHYRELKSRILIESICDYCIQSRILTERNYEDIMRGSFPRHARVDILLQILLRKRGQKVFAAFCRALRGTGVKDLADKLEKSIGTVSEKPYIRDWSTDGIMKVWPGIVDVLLEELQPEYILDFFMQENIFSVDEYEEIFWSMGRRREMTKTLLVTMKKHLPDAMFVLLYALKEVDEENTDIAERLEELIETVNKGHDDYKNCGAKHSNTDVQLVTVHEPAFTDSAPSSSKPRYSVEISVKKDGNVLEKVEVAIDKYMQNAGADGLLEQLLSLTGCELTGSELGCVIVHLLPHSKYAFEKLSTFCQNGEIVNFVLNLLREKDICSSLSGGEIYIDIKLKYNEGEFEPKEDEEIGVEMETDLISAIKDNWSFLCEELDVKMLIRRFNKKTVFTDQETTDIEGRAAKDRHEATDFFLKLLLRKGPRGIEFLMNALKEKNNVRILKRLQRSGPVYQNPDAVKENLLVHFESIVEEIDPSQFKDTFVDRNILDKKFFTDLRAKHPRRRCRAALFLREVLNKGNRAIYALLDVMTEMDCDVLLAKLIPTEENLKVQKQERKEAAHINEPMAMETFNEPSPDKLMWSCCLKVHVDIKGEDETKSDGSIDKEESLYENVQLDEGFGSTEDEPFKPVCYKGLDQTTRYTITRSECNLSCIPQSAAVSLRNEVVTDGEYGT
ncbi:hypothetical protein ACJMK2_040813 [Sinanodonta woodiana]|uniref:CARD domain-containing protein n=1 Tax=Sinanodonta woodiana TaxID=1069815 RepID=A0ABD3W3I2_SINWO